MHTSNHSKEERQGLTVYMAAPLSLPDTTRLTLLHGSTTVTAPDMKGTKTSFRSLENFTVKGTCTEDSNMSLILMSLMGHCRDRWTVDSKLRW